MHSNIASCNATLLYETGAYPVILLFCVIPFHSSPYFTLVITDTHIFRPVTAYLYRRCQFPIYELAKTFIYEGLSVKLLVQ